MKTGFRFSYLYRSTAANLGPIIVRCEQDDGLDDVLKTFKAYLLACGFSEETIKKCFAEIAEDE